MKVHVEKVQFFSGTPLTIQQNSQQIRDAELIERLCHADENALEQLYHHYYDRLFRFIGRVTQRDELIDEIINDVMYVVWQKADSYNKECKPSTWIFGIAFNKARQALRDSDRSQEESLDNLDEDNAWLGKQDASLVDLENNDWLKSALAELSPEHRTVMELTYYEGLHYGEIAVIMGCSENTIKTRMYYARKKLAANLASTNDSSSYTN